MSARTALTGAALALLAACGSPIVGAECRTGFVVCDGRCVDPERDREHCGSCGQDCGGSECDEGVCADRGDGGDRRDGGDGRGDAGEIDAGPSEGGVRPPPGQSSGGVGSPFRPDGGLEFPDDTVMSGCGLGSADCGDGCSDLQGDPEHCGSCGVACAQDQFCLAGDCVDLCEPPLSACGRACVDFANDERNCGGCGRVCASGLCEDGVCADAVPGHLVVIGHDYASVASPTMQRIAGNALFLAAGSPVRTLVYTGTADAATVAGVTRAFDSVVAADGRSFSPVSADPDLIGAQLLDADAFVIHAQRAASNAELIELGQRWGLAMTQFLLRSGVIVVFETDSSANGGTFQILGPAGLFVAAERSAIPSRQRLRVGISPLAVRATPEYQSQRTTVHFLEVESDHAAAVVDPEDEVVVAHRAVTP